MAKSFNALCWPNNDQKLLWLESSPEIADMIIDFLPVNFEMPSSKSQSSSEQDESKNYHTELIPCNLKWIQLINRFNASKFWAQFLSF